MVLPGATWVVNDVFAHVRLLRRGNSNMPTIAREHRAYSSERLRIVCQISYLGTRPILGAMFSPRRSIYWENPLALYQSRGQSGSKGHPIRRHSINFNRCRDNAFAPHRQFKIFFRNTKSKIESCMPFDLLRFSPRCSWVCCSPKVIIISVKWWKLAAPFVFYVEVGSNAMRHAKLSS